MGCLSRQRDLLPLPKPYPEADKLVARPGSKSSLRRLHGHDHWKSWVNEGVRTINALGGSSRFCSLSPNAAQETSLRHIVNSFEVMGSPPPGLTKAGAFQELCRSSVPYSTCNTPASFEKGNISLPERVDNAVKPEEFLGSVHRDLFDKPGKNLLRPADESHRLLDQIGLNKAYTDPAFKSPRVYANFLLDLHSRNLLEWQVGGTSLLGVFFVPKKSGQLRMILDTRRK